MLLFTTYQFCSYANTQQSSEWLYDSETKNMITNIIKLHNEGKLKQKDVKIGIQWMFEPTINFYRETKHLTWLLPVDREGIKTTDDYFYIFKVDLVNIKPNTYYTIQAFPKSETLLLKNIKQTELK